MLKIKLIQHVEPYVDPPIYFHRLYIALHRFYMGYSSQIS